MNNFKHERVFNIFKTAIWLLIIGGVVFLLIILWVVFDKKYFNFEFSGIDLENASRLGSFLCGTVGILWSAAGVLFIFAIFKEQQKLFFKQDFENTFFNLLNTYHQIVNNTSSDIGKGREFFSAVLKKIKNTDSNIYFHEMLFKNEEVLEIQNLLKIFRNTIPIGDFEIGRFDTNMNHEYEIFSRSLISEMSDRYQFNIKSDRFIELQYLFIYDQYHAKLGHYFRFIFNIFKYTIEERKKFGDEKKYLNLIQAQMSNDELGLLFYNALSENALASDKEPIFFNWLNDYNFFQNIDSDSLIDTRHSKFYPNNKFKFNT